MALKRRQTIFLIFGRSILEKDDFCDRKKEERKKTTKMMKLRT